MKWFSYTRVCPRTADPIHWVKQPLPTVLQSDAPALLRGIWDLILVGSTWGLPLQAGKSWVSPFAVMHPSQIPQHTSLHWGIWLGAHHCKWKNLVSLFSDVCPELGYSSVTCMHGEPWPGISQGMCLQARHLDSPHFQRCIWSWGTATWFAPSENLPPGCASANGGIQAGTPRVSGTWYFMPLEWAFPKHTGSGPWSPCP